MGLKFIPQMSMRRGADEPANSLTAYFRNSRDLSRSLGRAVILCMCCIVEHGEKSITSLQI